jgi:hypothetical protein
MVPAEKAAPQRIETHAGDEPEIEDPSKPKMHGRMTAADWDRFRHCNHERIDNLGIKFGGGISFGYHVSKKLSQELWQDLVHRFCASGLWIISENEEEWTLGRGAGAATVCIDEHGSDIVRDIWISWVEAAAWARRAA